MQARQDVRAPESRNRELRRRPTFLIFPRSLSNPGAKLLDFCSTHTKHGTSQFLIDNFEASLAGRSARFDGACPPPARRPLGACSPWQVASRGRNRTAELRPPQQANVFTGLSGVPASSYEPPAPRTNRQSPELESPLSHRKQTTENFLIAKFRPVPRQSSQLPPAAVHGPRVTRHGPRIPLIADETHSRAMPSITKQMTCNFLIANEFRFVEFAQNGIEGAHTSLRVCS